MVLLQIFSWFRLWNNVENRIIFEKVRRTKIVSIFWATLYTVFNAVAFCIVLNEVDKLATDVLTLLPVQWLSTKLVHQRLLYYTEKKTINLLYNGNFCAHESITHVSNQSIRI